MWIAGLMGLVMVTSLLWLAAGFRAAPLPPPPLLVGELPAASPPPTMAMFQLPTGVIHRRAAVAYRGGSFRERRDFAMTAVLVRHPRGDFLIDTGFGRQIEAHFRSMPALFRALSDLERGQPAADQLDAAEYDRRALRGILLTHAHWDHVSGLPDFPGTPVWLPPAERAYVRDGKYSALARSLGDIPYREYAFAGGPYLGFPQSLDLHGDGSLVIVPSPGHTPGSVIVFVTLPGERRYALVGDLAWQQEGISEREEKPWLVRHFVDLDEVGVRQQLLQMAAVTLRFPQIRVLPAHDARGFAELPRLSH